MSRKTYWHNFATGRLDPRTTPDQDDDAVAYIPQDGACQMLFSVCREEGDSIPEAIAHTLGYHLGDHGGNDN